MNDNPAIKGLIELIEKRYGLEVLDSHYVLVDEKFKQSDFLTINAPAIAFPYVRSYISNLTLQSGFSPIILPSVNFVKLAKKISNK